MKRTNDCLFCNLLDNWIYENDHFFAVFDAHPVSPGHALVIPKTHTVSLLDLNTEQWKFLQDAIKGTINVIEKTSFPDVYSGMINENITPRSSSFCIKMLTHPGINKRPEGYNIGNNEGEVAGRTIHHLHIQIIPRYRGDVDNPIGGIRTIIPELGDYKSQ